MKASYYHPITLYLRKNQNIKGELGCHTHTHTHKQVDRASPAARRVKNLPANAGDLGDTGLITESGRSPGERNGTLLQYSRLGNLMDIGARRATVHGVLMSIGLEARLLTLKSYPDINCITWTSNFVVAVQSLSCVQLFVTPWTTAYQASLSFTIS